MTSADQRSLPRLDVTPFKALETSPYYISPVLRIRWWEKLQVCILKTGIWVWNQLVKRKYEEKLIKKFLRLRRVLEDLLQPSAFSASHQYSPWLCGCTFFKGSSEIPLTPVMFSLGTCWPSLYQLMTGLGIPVASQVRFTELPAEIFIWRDGVSVKFGGDDSIIIL